MRSIESDVKEIVIKNHYNYRKIIKNRYPSLFKKLDLSELPFPEEIYLFYTKTQKSDHKCPVCGSIPNFRRAYSGYSKTCSIQCNNAILNKSIGENIRDIPSKKDLLKKIDKKYSAIPALLRRKYPRLYLFLKEHYKEGSITQKLYEWLYKPNKNCKICQKRTRFLDFRRGFQIYCSNKCMAGDPVIKIKKEKSLIKKTGFPYPMQNPSSRSKQKKNAFSAKIYTFPSGKRINIQGVEDRILDDLLKSGLAENEIITEEDQIPAIFWRDENNKKHRYYPDFYIPRYNLIIEAKTIYTFNGYESPRKNVLNSRDINFLKRNAVIKAGYNFKFMIR